MRWSRIAAVVVLVGLSACTPHNEPPASGTIVTSLELAQRVQGLCYAGDSTYAVVKKSWLVDFYPRYRDDLFKQGVTKWDSAFDCNHFSLAYVSRAQTIYYLDSFHDRQRAGTLAVGFIWYTTRTGLRHSIVTAVTDEGVVYLDPQTGAFLNLTQSELASVTLRLF